MSRMWPWRGNDEDNARRSSKDQRPTGCIDQHLKGDKAREIPRYMQVVRRPLSRVLSSLAYNARGPDEVAQAVRLREGGRVAWRV